MPWRAYAELVGMRRHLLPIAIVLGSLAAGCGGEDQGTQPRQPSAYPTNTARPITPASDPGPPPQNMPGGGRGSDPPHYKGKP
jgi:hypothetical protein